MKMLPQQISDYERAHIENYPSILPSDHTVHCEWSFSMAKCLVVTSGFKILHIFSDRIMPIGIPKICRETEHIVIKD